MVYACTALNKQNTLRALFAPSGFEKPQSLRFVRFSLTHIPAHRMLRTLGEINILKMIKKVHYKLIQYITINTLTI